MDQDFGINQAFIEELWLRYQENPGAVGDRWRRYFDARQGANGHNGHAAQPLAAQPVAMPAPTSAMLSLPAAPMGAPLVNPSAADIAAQSLAQRVHQMISAYLVTLANRSSTPVSTGSGSHGPI